MSRRKPKVEAWGVIRDDGSLCALGYSNYYALCVAKHTGRIVRLVPEEVAPPKAVTHERKLSPRSRAALREGTADVKAGRVTSYSNRYWRTKSGVLVVETDRIKVQTPRGAGIKIRAERAASGGFHGLLWLKDLTPAKRF
jgi:hypothetical protein